MSEAPKNNQQAQAERVAAAARLTERVSDLEHELPDQLAHAVEKALRRVLTDENVRRDFWRAGYDEMSRHATSGAAQWVGRRIVSAIGGALLAAGIWLGFKFGGWGK